MAAFCGKQGQVEFNSGAIVNVTSWSVEATADVAESTVMEYIAVGAAKHWKEYVTGLLNWTATVEVDLQDIAPATTSYDPDIDTDLSDEDGASLVLYGGIAAISAYKYTGNAIVTGISTSVDLNDVAKVTYSFLGNGSLTEAAVT